MNNQDFRVGVVGQKLEYRLPTLRKAGLKAKWLPAKNGVKFIAACDPEGKQPHQRNKWWVIHQCAWNLMESLGIREGFETATMMGDTFSRAK